MDMLEEKACLEGRALKIYTHTTSISKLTLSNFKK